MHCQTIVLGAGIIGVCTALHLQARGRKVVLIDRAAPGSGTSYGNAGLIERSSVIPYAFPRELSALLRYGLNRQADVRYSLRYLPKAGSWLFKYWQNSAPAALAVATQAMLPLVQRCVEEHDALIDAAGMGSLVKANGWIQVFRDDRTFTKAKADAQALLSYGLRFDVLNRDQLREREADLSGAAIGGIHWLDPKTVSDPGALVHGYSDLFEKRGGHFIRGDACSLRQVASTWQVDSHQGTITAPEVVIALGPQASDLFRPLGYKIPLEIKRGYHRHYRTLNGAVLEHPICDSQGGYVLAPMDMGIRLTTGIEFADPEDAANEIQLNRCEAIARSLFPLGEPIDVKPWLGRRPCLPDMRPVLGPAPNHKGLWFNFGHAHHGLTLGPVCGRLLAEMMTGSTPFTDPAPYSAARFK